MLILFCISLVTGATLYYQVGFNLSEVSIVGGFLNLFTLLIFRNVRGFILGLVIAGALILGALRLWIVPINVVETGSRALSGIVRSVDDRLDRTLLTVALDGSDATVQASVSSTDALPGDHIALRGQVNTPEDFVTDTGRIFPYQEYLKSKGVDAVVGNAQITRIESKDISIRNHIVRLATIARSWIARQLSKYVAFPVDGIVGGMLVGFQGGIPKYLSDIFRVTGTLHTLVLSGYNITVLATFVGLLLRRASFRIRNFLIFFGIISLVLVSGAGVAAVRAGIMGSIALLATATLRTYNVFRALLISFLFFFFIMPKTIFIDPGFHLSFLATLFIITILPILKEELVWIPQGKINLRELLILAFGLPIFMLPYIMYFSGLFPVVSPIANIIMVPIIPVLMLGGLAVTIFSPVSYLANFFGVITSFVGNITINILTSLSELPKWYTPNLSGFGVLTVYIILFLILFRKEIIIYLGHLRNTFRT